MTPRVCQRTHARHRFWGTSAGVLLAHAGVIWLLIHRLAGPTLTGSHEQVILASVVSEMPAPSPVHTAPARAATPLTPHTPVRPAEQPTAAPAVKAAPSELSPSPSASPAPPTTAPSGTIAGSTSARPAPSAAAALVLPSSDADYLHNPPPAYPRMSRRMGEQGTVLLRVFINAEGRAEKAEIRSSSGYPRLDEAALETVQRWRYVPGQRAGQPEAMWFNVPIRFVLD